MSEPILLGDGERYTFKRLPGVLARLGIAHRGVIHVGAHLGEEVPVYDECGFDRVILVEPDLLRVDAIRNLYGTVEVVHAACADAEGVAQLWRGPRTYHDSLLQSAGGDRGPVVRTAPLSALQEDCNVAVIDTQGTELDVLRTADLARLDLVVIETIRPPHQLPAADRAAVGEFFDEHGWAVVEEWQHDSTGHTDSLFAPVVPRG